jgi:malate dehydrogenase
MSVVAIIGAGPLAGALAHKLALRGRVSAVKLIDPQESVARGKALDIVQSGPVDGFATRVTGDGSYLTALGADVVVLADGVDGTEHAGEAALTIVRQLAAAGLTSPLLFAGGLQRELMARCLGELRIRPERVLGSAPGALASAMRALAGVILDTSPVEISLTLLGVPPRQAVVTWQEATVSGQPLPSVMAAHEIAALNARLPGLWPPGAYALGSAAARCAEALCHGSRRQYCCFVDAGRGTVAALPVVLKRGGVKQILQPAVTSAERTLLETALEGQPPAN